MSQFNDSNKREHWIDAKRVLRWLRGTRNNGFKFKADENKKLTGYTDSDWGASMVDRGSYAGYFFMLNLGPI